MTENSTNEPGLKVYANPAQMQYNLGECQENIIVAGRGFSKTSGIHAFNERRKAFGTPGSKGLFVCETFQQAKQRTLPSLIAGLRRLGIHENVHYVVGKKADKRLGFKDPIEPPVGGYENCIHWRTGRVLQLISLEVKGSANGINSDDINGDEVKYFNQDRYENEVLPTMRANEGLFGHLHYHWSITLTTSMPTQADAKWILKRIDEARNPDSENYKRLQLMEALNYDKLILLAEWNKASDSAKRHIQAQINKLDDQLNVLRFDTTYTLEADSFANISVLTERYLRRMRRLMPDHTFNTEILNMRPASVEKCFYSGLNLDKHTYPHAYNNAYLENTGLMRIKETCLQDADCIPNEPLHLNVDWGVSITTLTVGHYYSPAREHNRHELNAINSLYATWPQDYTAVAKAFCDYYAPHANRNFYLHHDPKTGWERRPGNRLFPTFADEFLAILKNRGWNCVFVTRQEMPTHMARWGMWNRVFRQDDPRYPRFTANRLKAKHTLNSMLNTPTVEDHRGVSKNKNSEKAGSGVAPEEATHFGDTVDIWLVDTMRGISSNMGDWVDLNKL